MSSDRNTDHLYPAFWSRYEKVLQNLEVFLDKRYPGYTCKLIEGYRSAAYQAELYAKGRTAPGSIVTYRDGTHGHESNHQSSLAADAGIFDSHGAYVEEPYRAIVAYYGHCVRESGLKWGGDWSNPDEPHAEWDEANAGIYALARTWQISKGLR